MAGFRETVGRRVLKNKLKSFRRETRVHNFESAKSAVILYDAQVPDAFQVIKEFRGSLKEKGISCSIFGYLDQKEIPQDILFRKGFHVITRRDLNWYLQPRGEVVELYNKEDPDMLIDFNIVHKLEVQFLVQLSPARFKIGCFTEEKNDYDLMMKLSDRKDLAYLAEQIWHYISILNPSK